MKGDFEPVIVGVGEAVERHVAAEAASEPIVLMEQALRAADADAGGGWLNRAGSLAIVAEYSWPYADAPALLCAQLGIHPPHAVYGEVGGETPVTFLHEAALRIARGESQVALVVGAEAAHAVAQAKKTGHELAWTPRADVRLLRGADMLGPFATRYGADKPLTVYPLYENAFQAAARQTPMQGLAESAALWSRASEVAARTPSAWSRKTYAAEDLASPSDANRRVVWPYTKHMIANPLVNQGAALIVTSRARAREAGIAEEKLVSIGAGAAAAEPADILARDSFSHSAAQTAVLEALRDAAGGDARGFDLLELYSCFPCVPKMALHSLNLPIDTPFTGIGALSFFGAPLNNYMSHAAVGMVRTLRAAGRGTGLLYGQGGFVTKHHGLLLTSGAPVADVADDYSVQARADKLRGTAPPVLAGPYSGAAKLETHTVVYAHTGEPDVGIVVARTEAGARTLARVPAGDVEALTVLTDPAANPIGRTGRIRHDAEGVNFWEFNT